MLSRIRTNACNKSIAFSVSRLSQGDTTCIKIHIPSRNYSAFASHQYDFGMFSRLRGQGDPSDHRYYQKQQARNMGRKIGFSQVNKIRPPTQKQRKEYNRRKTREEYEKNKHNEPGSKRKELKNWFEDQLDYMRKEAKGEITPIEDNPDYNQYTIGHAMIEDLMGNSANLTSTPTPRITDESQKYESQLCLVQTSIQTENRIPSDDELSLLVRAYRDKFGGYRCNNQKPVGVARVLQLLTQELGIPASSLKERTLTAVMTCASRPAEARKVLEKMELANLPLEYAYSILVDLHSKRGDFVQARMVLDEMVTKHKIIPPLPAYTSLIAACHRAVSKSTTPGQIKADATKIAWNAWTEIRKFGMTPDAMAYGAIIRFFSSRGQPEKCIDMIEEMTVAFQILPTTLIFTAALHAVAQSHRTALRFEGGKSRKNMRRQSIAAHHGKMARQILIRAEQCEVEQDDGFVAALMLCAAAAGDSATAKAILLASDVRRKDWLRPIGSKEYLRKLQPPTKSEIDAQLTNKLNPSNMLEGGIPDLAQTNLKNVKDPEIEKLMEQDPDFKSLFSTSNYSLADQISFGGDDAEIPGVVPPQVVNEELKLRALLVACAQSMAPRGLGDLWGGKKNRGFLDEQTQKLIVTRQVPKYVDNSIPGISSIKVGLGSMTWDEDEDVEHMGKALRRSKWMGIKQDDSFGNTLDDIDPELSDAFRDEIEQEKKRSFDDKFSNEGLLIEEDYRPKPTDQNTFDATFQIKPANAVLLEGIDREQEDAFGRALVDDSEDSGLPIEQYSVAKHQSDLIREHEEKYALDDFARAMPPGLPQNRIEKLRRVFESNLGYPNMLELIPLLRENMPERPPLSWLQKKNLQNAHFVMNRMQEKDLFNTTKSLNTALQVTATSNKLEKALSFHDIEFSRRGLVSNFSLMHFC